MATTYRLEAIEILKKYKGSLSAEDITNEIKKRGNVEIRGKTPRATLYFILVREIQKSGKKSAFIMEGKGLFSLRGRN